MLLKAVLLESLAAYLAYERSFARVRPLVDLQQTGMSVRTTTHIADVPHATPASPVPVVDFFSNVCCGQSVGQQMSADVQFVFEVPSTGTATKQRLALPVRCRHVIFELVSVTKMLSTGVALMRK